MKRSALCFFIAIPVLASCGGSQSGVIPSSPNNAPASGGASIAAANPVHEKPLNDTMRGGIAIGADGFIYASGQHGLQVLSQSLEVQPFAVSSPPDTWPAVPKRLSPAGAVSASSTTVGALATIPSPTPSPSAAAAAASNVQIPAVARFDTTTKTWFDIDFGTAGDVWVDLTPDEHSGFFVAGDRPSGAGFTGFVTEVPVFCSLTFVTLPEPVGSMTIGLDGFPWVASTDTIPGTNFKNTSVPSQIYHLGPGNSIRTVTLRSGSRVQGMVVGPDGALWFTDSGLNAIGRLDQNGSVSFTPLTSGKGLEPADITVGSDGNLWFAEMHGNKIGRITTAGAITEFKTSANANPQGMVGCPNSAPFCASKAVFFTETHAVGKAVF